MALAFYTTQPDADGTAGQVTLNFGVTDTSQHYHMPLLVSPWRYSTYQVS